MVNGCNPFTWPAVEHICLSIFETVCMYVCMYVCETCFPLFGVPEPVLRGTTGLAQSVQVVAVER